MTDIEKIYNTYFRPGKITTDTRKISRGDLFIALKGQKFDGNKFAGKAINQGAVLAVVDDPSLSGEKFLQVNNCLQFLQDLARLHREKSGFRIIGLTGTNGKTTTKELIKSVLDQRFICKATEGNLNNHIGVPLTLLAMSTDVEWGIVEMGANHPGEIRDLAAIALPDAGLITNIGKAHLEGFGSFEGVKKTKAELFDSLKLRNGKIYFNASNSILAELVGDYRNIVRYNSSKGICHAEVISSLPKLRFRLHHNGQSTVITSPLYGEFNMENILAAAAIGLDLGLTLEAIKSGIEKYYPSNNRSQIIRKGNTTLILDCYNANPSSMVKAIESFSEISANKKILILGGMKELGAYSREEHIKINSLVKSKHFDEIIYIGEEFMSLGIRGNVFDSFDSYSKSVNLSDYSDATILVKGSRAYKLENLLTLFQESDKK